MEGSKAGDEGIKLSLQRAHDDWQRRLTLWSAVGNVGGLVAVGSLFAENLENPEILALIFPALWAFAIGTTASVFCNVAMWSSYSDFLSNHRQTGEFGQPGALTTLTIGVASIVAALCFMTGYLYPLVGMTLRYWAKGGF